MNPNTDGLTRFHRPEKVSSLKLLQRDATDASELEMARAIGPAGTVISCSGFPSSLVLEDVSSVMVKVPQEARLITGFPQS